MQKVLKCCIVSEIKFEKQEWRVMKIAKDWQDYIVLDTGKGEKLERWGKYTLLRPDPQIIWNVDKDLSKMKPDAHYHRTENKSGEWKIFNKLPDYWIVNWREFKFKVQPMNFKHTGLFPEQAVNWDLLINTIKQAGRPVSVLNLFAYTGAASIVCAKAGANVTHVDAAKSMIDVSKENAKLNGIDNIRYINDDCQKFVEREIRRGKKYDIVLMDPPSFGRGPKGETWKIEDDIFNFVKLVKGVVADNALMVLINSYTTGLQPTVMANILNCVFSQGQVDAYEIGLPTEQNGIVLPCGCTAVKHLKN